MKIKQIHISNYRGFEELDLSLSDSHNDEHSEPQPKEMLAVFIGDNGAGKTSLLNAIRWALQNVTYRFFPDGKKEELTSRDLKIGASKISVNLTLENSLKPPIGSETQQKKYELDCFKMFYSEGESKLEMIPGDLQRLADDIKYSSIDSEQNIPIFAFYSSDRSFDDAKVTTVSLNRMLRTYAFALEAKTKFSDFEDWFIVEQSDENSIRLEEGNLSYKKGTVECVRQALVYFLKLLDVNTFGKISVGKSPFTDEHDQGLVMLIEKNGTKLPVKHLSDGERILIHLVGDIARRCVLASRDSNQSAYTQSKGIVLIDEIDIHLHPKWQANVISALQSTFPNIQFLITTHSPLVLSRVPNQCVHRIDNFKISEDNIYTTGRNPEHIMYAEQGVKIREESIQEDMDRFYELIESKDGIIKAKEILDRLFIGNFGPNDPETVRAISDYEFALMEFDEE